MDSDLPAVAPDPTLERGGVRLRRAMLVVLLSLVAATAIYAYGRHRRTVRLRTWRQQGIAAARAGDPATAVAQLVRYLAAVPNDEEALLAFAHARYDLPEPDSSHFPQTVVALRLLLTKYPNHLVEQRLLMRLYVQRGYAQESLSAADSVLALDARDSEALEARVRALSDLKRHEQALTTAQRWSAAAPDDVRAEFAVLTLMLQAHQPKDEILGRAATRSLLSPNDPRRELELAYALRITGDQERARTMITRATAHRPADDPVFNHELLRELEQLQLSRLMLQVLRDIASGSSGGDARRTLATRLWETEQWPDAAEALARAEPAPGFTQATRLALRAIALLRLGRHAEADALRAAIAQQQPDRETAAWKVVLDFLASPDRPVTPDDCEIIQAALQERPDNAYLRYHLGEAASRLGEDDWAAALWLEVGRNAVTWSLPLRRAAVMLAERGEFELALVAANEAIRRCEHGVGQREADVVLARVWETALASAPIELPQAVAALAERLQAEQPGEPHSLCLRVALLAADESRRAQAAAAIDAAIALEPPPPASVLLRLTAISRRYGLDAAPRCLQRCSDAHGPSAALAYQLAWERWRRDRPLQGAESLFDALAPPRPQTSPTTSPATAPATAASVEWACARVRFLNATRSPAARDAAIALAEAWPLSIAAQRVAIAVTALRDDAPAVEKIFDRLRSLTGEHAFNWRSERARWLLEQHPGDKQYADQAASLVTPVVDAAPQFVRLRLLLARALEGAGDMDGAFTHVSSAAQLVPASADLRLAVARLHQYRGEHDQAKVELRRLAVDRRVDPRLRHQAIVLLADQGDYRTAIELLSAIHASKPSANESPAPGTAASGGLFASPAQQDTTAWQLLVAAWYCRCGEYLLAEAIAAPHLDPPNPPYARLMADVLRQQQRIPEAEAVLAKLDTLSLPPGAKQLMQAEFAARCGNTAQAHDLLLAAIKEAPENAAVRLRLIAFHCDHGQTVDARAALTDALTALPQDQTLMAIGRQAALLDAARDSSLRPLLHEFLATPSPRQPPAIALAELLAEPTASPQDDASRSSRITRLADRFPGLTELQRLAARTHLEAGQTTRAATAARRVVNAAPADSESHLLLCRALAAADDWEQVTRVAQNWAICCPIDRIPADLTIARAQLRLGKPAAALETVQPLLPSALERPARYGEVLATYAAAMRALDGEHDLEFHFRSLLKAGPAGRLAYINCAVTMSDRSVSEDWLHAVERAIPPADATSQPSSGVSQERLLLADAWTRLAQRWGRPDYARTALQLLPPATEGHSEDPRSLLVRGSCAEVAGNFVEAEAAYRRAISDASVRWLARNNLAMLLARHSKDACDEAAELLAPVMAANPDQPGLYDTLAFVSRRAGRYGPAAEAQRKAIALNPFNLAYRVRLAAILAAQGLTDDVASMVASATRQVALVQELTVEDRQQLDSLNRAIADQRKQNQTRTPRNR